MDEFDDFWDLVDDYLILTADEPRKSFEDEEAEDEEFEDEENAESCYRRKYYYERIPANSALKCKRISVMGYSGSGKTYLSNRISEKYKIPVLHIEDIKYTKDWKRIEDSKIMPQIKSFMNKDLWVIDGNYGSLLINERLENSDLIILLLLPHLRCLLTERKKNKDMQALGYRSYWCRTFVRYVMRGCRGNVQKQFYMSIAGKYSSKTVILKSRRQIRRFLRQL